MKEYCSSPYLLLLNPSTASGKDEIPIKYHTSDNLLSLNPFARVYEEKKGAFQQVHWTLEADAVETYLRIFFKKSNKEKLNSKRTVILLLTPA